MFEQLRVPSGAEVLAALGGERATGPQCVFSDSYWVQVPDELTVDDGGF